MRTVGGPDPRGQGQLVSSVPCRPPWVTPNPGEPEEPRPRPGVPVDAEVCQGSQSCLRFPQRIPGAPLLPFPRSLSQRAGKERQRTGRAPGQTYQTEVLAQPVRQGSGPVPPQHGLKLEPTPAPAGWDRPGCGPVWVGGTGLGPGKGAVHGERVEGAGVGPVCTDQPSGRTGGRQRCEAGLTACMSSANPPEARGSP